VRAAVLLLIAASALAGGGQQASSRQNSLEQHLAAARQAESRQDYASAEQHYEAALEELEEDAGAGVYQRLGLVRHLQNKFAEAIPAFVQAIELNPQAWGSHLFLGIGYYRTNQFTKALSHLETAGRLQPENPEIQFWLGAAHLALDRPWKGFEFLERAVEQQPGNREAVRLLAQRYSEYSVALLNTVAERYADTPWGRLVHARVLEAEGRFEAALEEYRLALAQEPQLPGAHSAAGTSSGLAGCGKKLWKSSARN